MRTLDVGERHASWLELFFDLVFVLAVAQVARILVEHSDLGGFVRYVALFLPVWWSWVGFTFYADRFESDEATYRILMFAGMLTVIGFAIALGDAFTPAGDIAVVVCYVLMRAVLSVLYLRVAYYIPLARGFAFQYPIGLGLSSTVFLISLFFDGSLRYAMWAAAFAIELLTPLLNLRAARTLPIDRSHIPERFGLFTIIVLGESVVATGMGLAGVAWDFATVATACLGFAMAAATWWINFDFVEESALVSGSLLRRFSYIYGHFFIVTSIVATGVGVEHAIKEANEPHLHVPTLALADRRSGGLHCGHHCHSYHHRCLQVGLPAHRYDRSFGWTRIREFVYSATGRGCDDSRGANDRDLDGELFLKRRSRRGRSHAP